MKCHLLWVIGFCSICKKTKIQLISSTIETFCKNLKSINFCFCFSVNLKLLFRMPFGNFKYFKLFQNWFSLNLTIKTQFKNKLFIKAQIHVTVIELYEILEHIRTIKLFVSRKQQILEALI